MLDFSHFLHQETMSNFFQKNLKQCGHANTVKMLFFKEYTKLGLVVHPEYILFRYYFINRLINQNSNKY